MNRAYLATLATFGAYIVGCILVSLMFHPPRRR